MYAVNVTRNGRACLEAKFNSDSTVDCLSIFKEILAKFPKRDGYRVTIVQQKTMSVPVLDEIVYSMVCEQIERIRTEQKVSGRKKWQ